MCVCVCVCVCVRANVCAYMCMCLCVYAGACACMPMCMRVHMCPSVWVCTHTCMCACMCMCVSLYMYMSVSVSAHGCASGCEYVCFLCVCVCLSVHACAYICILLLSFIEEQEYCLFFAPDTSVFMLNFHRRCLALFFVDCSEWWTMAALMSEEVFWCLCLHNNLTGSLLYSPCLSNHFQKIACYSSNTCQFFSLFLRMLVVPVSDSFNIASWSDK